MIGTPPVPFAPLAELVDAPDSKSGSFGSAGSIPAGGTIVYLRYRPFGLHERGSFALPHLERGPLKFQNGKC